MKGNPMSLRWCCDDPYAVVCCPVIGTAVFPSSSMRMFLGSTAAFRKFVAHSCSPVGDGAPLSSAACSLKVERIVGASCQIVTRLSKCLGKIIHMPLPTFLYMYRKNKNEYSTAFLSYLIAASLFKVVFGIFSLMASDLGPGSCITIRR